MSAVLKGWGGKYIYIFFFIYLLSKFINRSPFTVIVTEALNHSNYILWVKGSNNVYTKSIISSSLPWSMLCQGVHCSLTKSFPCLAMYCSSLFSCRVVFLFHRACEWHQFSACTSARAGEWTDLSSKIIQNDGGGFCSTCRISQPHKWRICGCSFYSSLYTVSLVFERGGKVSFFFLN